jgi:hypothetical protein
MNPHPTISLALMAEFDRERTRLARPAAARRLPSPRLRAARSRRAARAAAAGC